MSSEVVVALVQVVSVTAIGIFTALIASRQRKISQQQLEINKYRVKLDLYDRRWEVYEHFERYVGTALKSLNPTTHDTVEFARATQQAQFLFGSDIKEYRKAMIGHGANLHKWHEMYRDVDQVCPPGYNPNEVTEGKMEESKWFAAQHDAMVEKFKPYLDLSLLARS